MNLRIYLRSGASVNTTTFADLGHFEDVMRRARVTGEDVFLTSHPTDNPMLLRPEGYDAVEAVD